jgi:hypothetical protein
MYSNCADPHADKNMRQPLRFSIREMLIATAVAAVVLTALVRFWSAFQNSDVRQMFGGAAGIDALRSADRVEAYRLGKLPDEINWQTATVSDYPVAAGPVVVPGSTAKHIAVVLQKPTSYGWEFAKSCIIRPGVRLDFIRGNDRLQILLCFECDIVSIVLNGEHVGGEDFDNVRGELVRAIRSLFPDDPVIQTLREGR